MTDMWNSLVNDYVGRLVSPDWAALVALIPIGLAVAIALYLLWLVRRLAIIGPATRGGSVAPRPPAGAHLPGPSLSPLLIAGSAAVLFLGLAAVNAGKAVKILGTVPLRDVGPYVLGLGVVLTLGSGLYWLREAMHDYDRTHGRGIAAAQAHREPPAGVHVPGPSFRPLLISIAAGALFLGLALARYLGVSLFLAAIVMIVIVGIQWLRDATAEYRLTEKADRTGHLEATPAPRFPWLTLGLFVALTIGAVLIGTGNFPPGARDAALLAKASAAATAAPAAADATGAGGAGAAPAGSAGPAGSAAPAAGGATGAAAGSGGGGSATVRISAQNVAYDQTDLSVVANTAFSIDFTNNDAGIPHNVTIRKDSPSGDVVFQGEIFNGVATKTYSVPALPAGTYAFVCAVHPNMVGTLTAK